MKIYLLSPDDLDKEEFNFLLEDATQDRTVEPEGRDSTDKLLMEDNKDFLSVGIITEQDILKNRNKGNLSGKPSLISDATYLEQFYAIHGVSDFQGYLNYLAKRYEPTYFLNEAYIPPIKFWPLFDLQKEGYNPDFSTGTPTPPEPKHFVKPIPINDTVLTPTKIDPAVLKILHPTFQATATTINKDFVSCFPKRFLIKMEMSYLIH